MQRKNNIFAIFPFSPLYIHTHTYTPYVVELKNTHSKPIFFSFMWKIFIFSQKTKNKGNTKVVLNQRILSSFFIIFYLFRLLKSTIMI